MAAVQAFLDSQVGVVVATFLHSLGAIAMLGGFIGYLAWVGYLRRGEEHPDVLVASAFATYLAIAVNLLGGFMRTYQSGHPRLTEFAHEPWVQILAVKHVALFAGMGAAVYLFQRVAPRLLRLHRDGGLARRPARDHALGSVVVAVSIALASILGALTQVQPLGAGDLIGGDDDGHDEPHAQVAYHNASGVLTSTPVAPRFASGDFEVANGTEHLHATLVWQPPQFALRLVLLGPGGDPVPTDPTAAEGRAEVDVPAPAEGRWGFRVESDLAVDAAWELSVRLGGHDETLLAETVTVPGGSFFEINTEMEQNTTMSWRWSTDGTPVYFNVHSHFDDQVQNRVEERAAAHEGAYTNDRAGGYSLLWENEGEVPVTLTYRVWGPFEVDSYFPPR